MPRLTSNLIPTIVGRKCLSSALLGLACASLLWAEDLPVPKGRSPLPVLPKLEPRLIEGADAKLHTKRVDDERKPVAAHIESLYGADAVVDVVVGQGRLITARKPIANEKGTALIAVGDPSVVDFEILPNPRMVRLLGKRPGITDLVITTEDEQTLVFEVHVKYDLPLLQATLRQQFADAEIKLSQLRDHVVLEGEARSSRQLAMIEEALRTYLTSLAAARSQTSTAGTPVTPLPAAPPAANGAQDPPNPDDAPVQEEDPTRALPEAGARPSVSVTAPLPRVINLMKVPGVQQVMLQVKVAELNRTGLRRIGADIFFRSDNGTTIGTRIAGATNTLNGLTALGTNSTAFGIFPSANLDIVLNALRENAILNVLAEPNLMALNGQPANFLAGGQFPVPVPQGGGVNSAVTVQFKDFGVSLAFIPYIIDEDTIRLQVAPEVSSIDQSLGTVIVVGGTPVPGINTRRVETTVELSQGQTLALAGLLQVQLDARTQRLPGLGDLPYLGPMFSNTSHQRVEKELLVLVTPYLVHPMDADQVGPLPGSEIEDPNDLEFYLLNRMEGRTGRNFRSTTSAVNPLHLVEKMKLEQRLTCGPLGHSR